MLYTWCLCSWCYFNAVQLCCIFVHCNRKTLNKSLDAKMITSIYFSYNCAEVLVEYYYRTTAKSVLLIKKTFVLETYAYAEDRCNMIYSRRSVITGPPTHSVRGD